MQRLVVMALATAGIFGAGYAEAGTLTCGGQTVASSVRRCPDGSPPVYHSQSLQTPSRPSAAPSPSYQPPQPAAPARRQSYEPAPRYEPLPNSEPQPQYAPAPSYSDRPLGGSQAAEKQPSYQWATSSPASSPAGDASSLFGVWHTSVTGGVWTTPSAVPGYEHLHVSPGVKVGDLTIDSGGYWAWNSWGGKTGRWEQGDADYPIVLIDTAEGRRWKVGPDRRHSGQIYVFDGFYSYSGKR